MSFLYEIVPEKLKKEEKMKIKIKCEREDCKNCKEGECICKELVLLATKDEFIGRGPGSDGSYYRTLLSCGSYKKKE